MNSKEDSTATSHAGLRRELGVPGAMMMGLGSIVGTGIFVSIGIGAGVAGPSVTLAIVVAAMVAICNGLSSAQLAASHPVSGGTYEYGYRYAWPLLGFIAGWMFLCAKSASAATAALGLSGYVLSAMGANDGLVLLAVGVVVVLTVLVLSGIRRSNQVNIAIVSITIATLVLFVIAGSKMAFENAGETLRPFFPVGEDGRSPLNCFLEACALMFVAFTGYGRIATLGEEVHEPHRTIPRAIAWTLGVSALLYITVGLVAVSAVGADAFASMSHSKAAPLELVAERFEWSAVRWIVALGAVTAMLGVLLNLILGLSRVLLAMGRRRDMPYVVSRVDLAGTTPWVAVIAVGIIIAGLAMLGSVKTTWSFSAFTVLIYYAITNFCALRLGAGERLYPRWIALAGLISCLALAFFVESRFWLTGLAVLVVGIVWHYAARALSRGSS